MKYCKKCGGELKEGAKFCPNCGGVIPAQEKSEDSKKNEAESISPVSDSTASIPKVFCKSCGAPLKEGAKFCQKCGSPVSPPIGHVKEQDLQPYDNISSVSDESDKIKPPRTRISKTKPHKNKISPLLFGIIPVLIVAGITIFLYKTNRLPFINQSHARIGPKNIFPKNKKNKKEKIGQKITAKKAKNKIKTSQNKSVKKSKTKGITYVYPKKPIKPFVSSSYTPSQISSYKPPKPVYHINHVRIAFNTFRSNLESAKAELISFTSEHVSGESGVSFVVLSHVYSFASNISANSIEMFEVEFTAAVPQSISVPQVKIVSRISGRGFVAENISHINLSSSGVYKIAIPVKIPEYFRTGSYYFNVEAEVPGISLTSNNVHFRVE